MTTTTQCEHAQTALEDFEVRKLAAIGAVSTSSGLVERRPIEYRRELENQFVRGYRAAESRLHTQVAAITAGNREELAHELFAAAQLAPGEGIEDAVSRIAAALTAATAQPAAPQGVAYAVLPECGAIGEQAGAWMTIVHELDVACPGWTRLGQTGEAAAVAAIQKLASNGQAPAGATDDRDQKCFCFGSMCEHCAPKRPTAQAAPAATPSAASIAWNALRDLTDPLGEDGAKIMEHVRIFAQRQYEAGLAESRKAPAAGAVEGPTVTREFTNELGNAIRITVEGPNSMHENILTPMEAEQFRSALNEHAMRAADTTWCAYVAGMICTYLKEDADGPKAKAIAGIIERRLMFLSKSTAPMYCDTLYLLRRLLSNQFTFTSAEFRAELEKIVEGAVINHALAAAPTPAAQADSQPAPVREESAAPKLRAMAINYPEGACWDKLDAQACMEGALEIEALRAARAQADSVLEDAERYRHLRNKSQVVLDRAWFGGMSVRNHYGHFLCRDDALAALEAAIDAARKQGGKHD